MIDLQAVRTVFEVIGGVGGSLLVLLPGWVLLTVYARGVKGPDVADGVFLLQTAFAGLFVHMSASPWTYWLIQRLLADPARQVWPTIGWSVGVLVLIPVLLGAAFGYVAELSHVTPWPWMRRLTARVGVSASVRTSAAWIMAFRPLGPGVFLRVHRRDGSPILGRFGTASLASADPAKKDLFLEELWSADSDGWFLEAYPNSAGIWIAGDNIESIEFYLGVDSSRP